MERGLLHNSLPYTLPLCRKKLNADGGGDSCSLDYMELPHNQYESKVTVDSSQLAPKSYEKSN